MFPSRVENWQPFLVNASAALSGVYAAMMSWWLADELYALIRLWDVAAYDPFFPVVSFLKLLLFVTSVVLAFAGTPVLFAFGFTLGRERVAHENRFLWIVFCAVGLFLCVMSFLWVIFGVNAMLGPDGSPTELEWWRLKVVNMVMGTRSTRPVVEIGQQSDPTFSVPLAKVAPVAFLKLFCAIVFCIVATRAIRARRSSKSQANRI